MLAILDIGARKLCRQGFNVWIINEMVVILAYTYFSGTDRICCCCRRQKMVASFAILFFLVVFARCKTKKCLETKIDKKRTEKKVLHHKKSKAQSLFWLKFDLGLVSLYKASESAGKQKKDTNSCIFSRDEINISQSKIEEIILRKKKNCGS